MRSRISLFALLLVVSSFVLPLVAHAGIPFFGPIIEKGWLQCPLGWWAVITVVNNIISLLITLAIVFVAPLMIAWAGFLFVVNPVNASGKEQAKKVLTHTIVGIVIALAGYMIVAAIMAALYNPGATSGKTTLGVWSNLITSGGLSPCIDLKGSVAPPVVPPPTVTVACSISPLSPLTDSQAQQMEGGQTVIWPNNNPMLQRCVNKFIGLVGGTVTSAYRPQAYQTHLFEIRDRWCTQELKSNSNPVCNALKSTVSAEVTKHFGSSWSCGAVAATASTHGAGTGVDISRSAGDYSRVAVVARQSCLDWPNYSGDPVHYNLISGCSCQN